MKRLLLGSALLLLGGFYIGGAQAQCPDLTNRVDGNGAFVEVHAVTYDASGLPSGCDDYVTPVTGSGSESYTAYAEREYLGQSGSLTASASATLAGMSVSSFYSTSNLYLINQGAGRPRARDEYTFTITTASFSDPFVLKYKECSRYEGNPNPKLGTEADPYITPTGYYSVTDIGPQLPLQHDYRTDYAESICNIREYSIALPGIYTIVLAIDAAVSPGEMNVGGAPDKTGAIYAHHELDGFTGADEHGVTCVNSAGNTAPGCGEPPLSDEERDQAFADVAAAGGAGNVIGAGGAADKASSVDDDYPCDLFGGPINYFYGYKHKDQIDYANGILSFVRNYRSDRDWISAPVMGTRWRHNFEGYLAYSAYNGDTFADVINAAGARVKFYNTGSGWTPYYDDVTATLTGDSTNGFTYTTNNDTRYIYGGGGKLERIEYQGYEAVNLTYSATSGLLETVSNEHGQSLGLNYNGDGLISSVVTPTGTFVYGYDANANLTSVTKPDTQSLTYHYDDTSWVHALTSIEDERGETIGTYTYDAATGKALTTSSPVKVGGSYTDSTYAVAYNADGSVTTTNPLGKQTTYTFETVNGLRKLIGVEGHVSTNCAAANKAYSYTPEGWLESKTDWEGNVTSYGYDAYDRLDTITDDDGGADERDTVVTYTNTSSHLVDTITRGGLVIDYDYDAYNRLTQVTYTDTAASTSRVHGFAYAPNTTDGSGNTVLGKLETYTDPRSHDTDFTYDANGMLETVTNALGHEWEVYARDSAGRITEIIDPNGVKDKIDYDALGRITKYTQANNRAAPVKGSTTYAYNEDGALYRTTLANGVYLKNFYDRAGRREKINGSGIGEYYYFDLAGNVTETKRKIITTGSTPITFRFFQQFDELSRVIETHHTNDSTEYGYDKNSNVTSITDGNGRASSLAYDGLNRLLSHTDRRGGVSDFAYNILDDLEGVGFASTTDSDGNAYAVDLETTYTRNSFGEVTQEDSPDRGTTTYGYDANGNLTSRIDAEGREVQYGYDDIDRLISITYPNDTSLNVTLTYDAASGCGSSDGRLCSVSSPSFGTVSYVWDDAGRVTQVSETPAGTSLNLVTSYAYDAANYLTDITYPSGRVVSYSYNDNGEIIAVDASVNSVTTTLASNIVYMAFGPVETMDYGNGLSETNTYDAGYRLLSRDVTPVQALTLTYDSNGNIKTVNVENHSYSFNDELIKQGAFEYVLDGAGNRLNKSRWSQNIDIDYHYDTTPGGHSSRINEVYDAYAASSVASLGLDDAGLTESYGVVSYVWDEAGRLSEVKQGLSTLGAYAYDAQNLRTAKTVSGATTYYVHGAGGKLYGAYDSSGNLITEYVYMGSRPLAQIGSGTSETLTYLHVDHLSTPREGTDASGNSVWSWAYAHNVHGEDQPTGTVMVNLRMTGQYYDEESGLFYNWHRYYDPETGRYVSSDPIGLAGGINTFAYALANPARYVDPEGLQVVETAASAVKKSPAYRFGSILGILGTLLCQLNPACVQALTDMCLSAAADTMGVPVLPNTVDEPETGEEGGKKPKKTPEDLLDESDDVDTQGKVTQGHRPGGEEGAEKDLEDIIESGTLKPTDKPGGFRGKTPDGRPVNSYPESETTGGRTIEIINPDGTRIKLRY